MTKEDSNKDLEIKFWKTISDALWHAGVIQINTKQLFTLSSGKKSPFYLDHRRLFSHPEIRTLALSLWAEMLKNHFNHGNSKPLFAQNYFLVGTATAGIAPAFGLAEILECHFNYARSEPKKHGMGKCLEGMPPPKGAQAIVIEDMITTGGSAQRVVNRLQEEGVEVAGISSWCRDPGPQAALLFKSMKLNWHWIFKSEDYFNECAPYAHFTQQEREICLQYLESKL